MKRLMLVWVVILCLVPAGGWAEEDAAPALYPIRENGLWGYMNRAGEVVIEPQWISVEPFSGGVAIVEADGEQKDSKGLIRTNGEYILLPEYRMEETRGGYIYSQWDEDLQHYGKEGYYDKASCFLLPPSYDYIYDYGWDVLLVHDGLPEDSEEEGDRDEDWVDDDDWEEAWDDEEWEEIVPEDHDDADADPYYGFIRRDTGESVFPNQHAALYDEVGYYDGYVLVSDEHDLLEDGEWAGIEVEYHLYDLSGQEVVFPDGVMPDSGIFEGVLRISHVLTDEEAEQHESGWGTVYGLGNPDGEVIVDLQYDYLAYAGDGLISIWLDDRHGLIDLKGNVILEPTYEMDWGGPMPQIIFSNGYAVIEGDVENRTIIIGTDGHEVFHRLPDEGQFRLCSDVMEKGLIWYEASDGFGLMRVPEQGTEMVTDPVFEASLGCGRYEYQSGINFCEGLHPVKQNGLWGYIDEQAQWVIRAQYDKAASFSDGLASAEKDGRLMYIDHSGDVVWQEK